ncbi:hypothetical protein BX661DRAFT_178558 [Kickxella alabastrina]|uniref:uncharacterized protein n=1 Tax=Kickxella alabastrina TaxID=61397 RepID=UPI00221ED3C7|nr:uncharacterized protein BX661DRAFT_178558 [Kickxella alabastrina]KAI7833524.1 hypothetical protein BX661DRAFT_178558 [Kickxella alabastrina]
MSTGIGIRAGCCSRWGSTPTRQVTNTSTGNRSTASRIGSLGRHNPILPIIIVITSSSSIKQNLRIPRLHLILLLVRNSSSLRRPFRHIVPNSYRQHLPPHTGSPPAHSHNHRRTPHGGPPQNHPRHPSTMPNNQPQMNNEKRQCEINT